MQVTIGFILHLSGVATSIHLRQNYMLMAFASTENKYTSKWQDPLIKFCITTHSPNSGVGATFRVSNSELSYQTVSTLWLSELMTTNFP